MRTNSLWFYRVLNSAQLLPTVEDDQTITSTISIIEVGIVVPLLGTIR